MKIGFTSTIPMEVIYAAGHVPVDLNNRFIMSAEAGKWVKDAELRGFPRNICAWIKGLYSVALHDESIDRVVAVCEGDCSNTKILMEILKDKGVKTLPFSYPSEHEYENVKSMVLKFCHALRVDIAAVVETKRKLDEIRRLARRVDDLTWRENKVSGEENHRFLINCSDFSGDFHLYGKNLKDFIREAELRDERKEKVRLAFMGVPPIFSDLYERIIEYGGDVVFNEMQRQFSMPFETEDIFEQYYLYTYPYSNEWRSRDALKEIERRGVHGIVHYVQSFCHRQLEDVLLRDRAKCPVLTVEGEMPGPIDERTKIRLQSFIEMLKDNNDLRY